MNPVVEKIYAAGVKVGICPDGTPSGSEGCGTSYSLSSYVDAFRKYAEMLGAVVVVLSIIYAAYIYLTSQGDSAKINTAKDRILGAILGFFLLFVLLAILHYIGIGS